MLHYLSLLPNYDARAAGDNLVDDRVEDWFELLVGKSNSASVDSYTWIIVPNDPEFKVVLIQRAVKFRFKLPSTVKSGRRRRFFAIKKHTSLSKASIMLLMNAGSLNADPSSLVFNIFSPSRSTKMPPALWTY